MTMRRVIHKGAFTSTGGKMLEEAENLVETISGVGEALCTIGMLASCPICDRGYGAIVPTEAVTVYVNNVQIALDGDIVDCGCPYGDNTVIATQDAMSVIIDYENQLVTTFSPFRTIADYQHTLEAL